MSSEFEFSRPFKVEDAANVSRQEELNATQDERAALARRFGLLSIEKLEAQLEIRPDSLGYVVKGRIAARVTQSCTVTLDPVGENVKEMLETHFILPEYMAAMFAEEEENPSFDKDFEELSGPIIDLGELVSQVLAVSLNPYPRSSQAEEEVKKLEKPSNPFDVLAVLKEKG